MTNTQCCWKTWFEIKLRLNSILFAIMKYALIWVASLTSFRFWIRYPSDRHLSEMRVVSLASCIWIENYRTHDFQIHYLKTYLRKTSKKRDFEMKKSWLKSWQRGTIREPIPRPEPNPEPLPDRPATPPPFIPPLPPDPPPFIPPPPPGPPPFIPPPPPGPPPRRGKF